MAMNSRFFVRLFLAGCLVVAVAPCVAQEFQWTDDAGKRRSTKDRKAVPGSVWKGVTASMRGVSAISGERFTAGEGTVLALEGIQAPDMVDDGTVLSAGGETARARLDQLTADRELAFEWEGDRATFDGALLCHAFDSEGRLLSEILLEEGLVRLALEDFAMRYADRLRAAQAAAQSKRLGVWARPGAKAGPDNGYFLGIAMPLYSQDPDFDYGPFLQEIKDFGATHVEISWSWLMEDWRSNEIGPVKGRSASWKCISRTTQQARDLGLEVVYLPLVLLRTGTVDYWRGNIAPTRLWLWFRNYARYVNRTADLAREHGVQWVSAGSEFTSLEHHTGPWKTIIANLRRRSEAKLTYSANWDHVRVIKFWNDLDAAGMTAYHSLTEKNDPTVEELKAAWLPIKAKLLEIPKDIEIPIFFTEVGYASQDGINKDPWNYFINPKKPDIGEQADCFTAYLSVWDDAPPEFRGWFLWKWWRNSGPDDVAGYTVWEKPAFHILKAWFTARRAKLGR